MTEPVDPGAWGVTSGYEDYGGTWQASPPATVDAILQAMGAGPGGPPRADTITMRVGRPPPDLGPGQLITEDGTLIPAAGGLPADVPTGYHTFEPRDGPPRLLIVSPGRVPLPARHEWGLAAQVYAARSSRSWGIGDMSDLSRLGAWGRRHGAGFTLVNPLHAPTPTWPVQPSPYFPGSRCFFNPIYISVADVPGASEVDGFDDALRAGLALNAHRLIDRDRVWSIKRPVLEKAFQETRDHRGFARYLETRGHALDRFAIYCAVAERHGTAWRSWPEGAESSASPDRKRFHAWLQWITATQSAAANRELGLVLDLAVGVDPDGADAWIWKEAFAPTGFRVGAPPDEFNTKGQDWGLPPFDPWRLRQAGYAPWIEALRANMAHGAGLRIDHVMGLFRLYWIPTGVDARQGAYVRYPHEELLDILALEAERAGAYVVGEDLGTVEKEMRRQLADRRVLSYRLWWFEDRPTTEWPEMAMGAVTTHDLPTVAGILTESDIRAQRDIGTDPNEEAATALRRKVLAHAAEDDAAAAVLGVYEDLARAPCYLLAATLEDVLAVEERPNMPGTTHEWPNWSLALPQPLEDLEKGPLAAKVAGLLRRGRGG